MYGVFRSLALVFALSGCAVAHQEYDARVDSVDAIPIVLDYWSAELDFDLQEAPFPHLLWIDTTCLDDGVVYPEIKNMCLLGWYNGTGDGEIVLAVPRSNRVSDSSLAHEMLHWSLDMATTKPDPNHSGPLWSKVDDANDLLDDMDF